MTETATARSIVAGGDIDWQPPAPGAFGSSFRLGEWITGPVTPLFEDWALTRLEAGMHGWHYRTLGQPAPLPHHVVINGWYFYSLAWLPVSARALLRWAPRLIPRIVTQPRRVAPVIPPTVHLGIHLLEREWREELLPRFMATTDRATFDVESATLAELPALIDAQLDAAGEYFGSVTAVGGAAYKYEYQLNRFYQRHLEPAIGGSYLDLLVGLADLQPLPAHAVETLDWAYPTVGEREPMAPSRAPDTTGLRGLREEREAAARAVVGDSKRKVKRFADLLEGAQHYNLVREEQMREFTRAWPAMRKALARLGGRLVELGVLRDASDVYFLRRAELIDALATRPTAASMATVEDRRAEVRAAARLVPPAYAGELPWLFRRLLAMTVTKRGASEAAGVEISGIAVSPGVATARARVVRGSEGFECLLPGEILVAPMTTPAWTPLFASAAAVVTDGGNAFSHASVIAREYGIPAVVGCGDATRRLPDGQVVTVDGSRGTVTVP